jgi:predicted Fe-Mo cluster-binding NifX family protein
MGNFEEVADINCKVVVEVSDGDIENAKSIINSMEGTTDDPNVRMPSELDKINEDALILKNLEE